jgi:uncharacterized membrane protein YqjE
MHDVSGMNDPRELEDTPTSSLGDVVRRIATDVGTIAGDELQLAKRELGHGIKMAATDGAAIILGGVVALIGLGMLCVTAVVALAPVIPALWLRMLMMAILYLVVGTVVAGAFVRKLKGDTSPAGSDAIHEAVATVENIKRGLTAEGAHHAH